MMGVELIPIFMEECTMTHQLPALPYANNALEPHIDEQTMMIHHDRHMLLISMLLWSLLQNCKANPLNN